MYEEQLGQLANTCQVIKCPRSSNRTAKKSCYKCACPQMKFYLYVYASKNIKMLIEEFSGLAQYWKQLKYPPIGNWLNR